MRSAAAPMSTGIGMITIPGLEFTHTDCFDAIRLKTASYCPTWLLAKLPHTFQLIIAVTRALNPSAPKMSERNNTYPSKTLGGKESPSAMAETSAMDEQLLIIKLKQ